MNIWFGARTFPDSESKNSRKSLEFFITRLLAVLQDYVNFLWYWSSVKANTLGLFSLK